MLPIWKKQKNLLLKKLHRIEVNSMSDTNKNPQSISTDKYTVAAKNIEFKQKQQDDFGKRAEEIIRPMLERQKAIGIRIGLLAASKAVMERLNDTSKPLLKRIELIKKFCNVAMKDEKGFLNDESNNNEKPAEATEEVSNVAEVEENG